MLRIDVAKIYHATHPCKALQVLHQQESGSYHGQIVSSKRTFFPLICVILRIVCLRITFSTISIVFATSIMNPPYSRALKSGSSSCFLTNGVFFNADFSGLFRGAIDTGKRS
jgi:hypothetical protein